MGNDYSERLTIRQLRFFLTVVDAGGFTVAATRLFVSQPSISNAIAELEKALGTPLLVRSARPIRLTGDGELLAAQARRILGLVDETVEMLGAPGREGGRLAIGAGPSVGTYVLPHLLGKFRSEVPAVSVQLRIAPGTDVGHDLRSRRIDLAVLAEPLGVDFDSVPFMQSVIQIVAPRSHALAGRADVSLAEVASESILIRERDSWTRQAFEGVMSAHGLALPDVLELGNNEAIRRAVASGLGLAPLPTLVTESDVESGELVVLQVESFPLPIAWRLCWMKGDRLTRAARRFIEFTGRVLTNPPPKLELSFTEAI
jgi:DNA-binding transcriptional LysR family regulator